MKCEPGRENLEYNEDFLGTGGCKGLGGKAVMMRQLQCHCFTCSVVLLLCFLSF